MAGSGFKRGSGKPSTGRFVKERTQRGTDHVDAFVRNVRCASSAALVDLERTGVGSALLNELSARMSMPAKRLYRIIGVPKATADRKAAAPNARVVGSSGHAAIGVVKLIALAEELAAESTSDGAESFDAASWVGAWIERPQPALGGKRPSEILDTPTGQQTVARLLGSIGSGAYQ